MTDTPTPVRSRRAWAPEASVETAALLRLLMARPWLVAGRDDEAIAKVKLNQDLIRDTLARLGWVLVVERDLVRLRKSPPTRRDTYAATGPSPRTCQWFFLLVAAAEQMGRHVGLSSLVTAARSAAAEAGVVSTGDIIERRGIVAALKMLAARGVIEELDGDVDIYVQNEDPPVLLAVHHTRLLHVIANYAGDIDPVTEPAAWLDAVEREPDAPRRMRRRLVDDTLVHVCDLDDAEADWLSRRVRGDDGAPLAAAFGLHLERRAEGAAFVVPEDAYRHARELGPFPFPVSGTVPHAALLLCIWASTLPADSTESVQAGWRTVSDADVCSKLTAFAADHNVGSGGWGREHASDPTGRLRDDVAQLLVSLDLVRTTTERTWRFSPAIARWPAPKSKQTKQKPADFTLPLEPGATA